MNVLVIGSGISGLSSAIFSAEKGNNVLLASPFMSESSQSVMAAGGINGAVNTKGENDTIENHINDTLKGGCFLENKDDVEALCKSAPEILKWLEELGVVFTRQENGELDLRAFGGQCCKRTAYAGAVTGKMIVTALVQKCRELECKGKIERLFGRYFYSALIDNGKCYGAILFNLHSNNLEIYYADSVVFAAGGMNQLFGKTTGSMYCDGYAAGKLFEQGIRLRNLEMIQYHPTTIETPQKRMLITEAVRGEGGRLYYLNGNERVYFMEDKYGPNGNLMSRDIVSKCIYDCPSQVYLDITFAGRKKILEKLQEVYELCLNYLNLDITKECIPVYPSVHFFMGGISVDKNHETNIKNLYVVGECASKYHGANRLGGNSLLAAIYGGKKCAEKISTVKADSDESGKTFEDPEKLFAEYINEQQTNFQATKESKSKFPAVYIRQELAKIMNEDLGITRNQEKLQNGIKSIEYFLAQCEKIKFDKDISVYDSYSLQPMLLLSKAILMSALERKETRGAHIREDYPETKEEFRKSTIAELCGDEIKISFEEI